jgi:genome maintenance exonuclease 1
MQLEARLIKLTRRDAKHSYKAGKRYHLTPHGELPGVTTILDATSGVNFKSWRDANPEESKRCLQRGLDFHDEVEAYLTNGAIASSPLFQVAHRHILPYIKPVVLEHQVYSVLGFSGSLDCLAYWNGMLTLFDWKTSSRRKTASHVTGYLKQVAAYAYALKETDGVKVERCSVVVLTEGSDHPQLFELEGDVIDAYWQEFYYKLQYYQAMEAGLGLDIDGN